jgi:proliferating cell nuclear antigen PCNA
MKLVMKDVKLLKQSVDAMVDLIKDTEFVINEYGMSLKAIDVGQIAMVIFNIPRDCFEEFEVKDTKKIGINLPSLHSVLKRAKNNEKVILETKENKKLGIIFEGENRRSFSINLLDLVSSELPNPDISYDANIRLNSNTLLDGVKDASLFANYLIMKATKNEFIISAKGPQGDIENKTPLDSKAISEKEVKDEATSMYSIEYLQHLLKGTLPDTEVEIFLKSNAPLKLKYAIDCAAIQFFLAPRDIE